MFPNINEKNKKATCALKNYLYFCHEVDEDDMGHPIQRKILAPEILKHK